MSELLTIDEAAARARVCTRTIRRLLASGSAPGVRLGRQWRIPRADFEAWIQGRWEPPAPSGSDTILIPKGAR